MEEMQTKMSTAVLFMAENINYFHPVQSTVVFMSDQVVDHAKQKREGDFSLSCVNYSALGLGSNPSRAMSHTSFNVDMFPAGFSCDLNWKSFHPLVFLTYKPL